MTDIEHELISAEELRLIRTRLAEAEETLRAIRSGEVDAIVVNNGVSTAMYTLKSAFDPYRALVETMSEGGVTVSQDGVIVYCNAVFANMLDMPRERVTGKNLSDFIVIRDHKELFLACLRGLDVNLHTAHMKRNVRISAAPLMIDDQLLYCLIVTDLTRQQLRLRHEAVVQSSQDAIYSLDKDFKVDTWNPGAGRLYLYSASEVIGRTLLELIVPDDYRHEYDAQCARMRAGERVSMETVRCSKTGRRIDVASSWSPIRAEDGSLLGVAAVSRDISDRKRADEHKQLLMNEVNHRVKNLLSVVQVVARQTAMKSEAHSFADRFSLRLAGLAASHDLLVQSEWRGVEMSDIIRSQILHFEDFLESRVVLEGPKLQITPAAAQTIGMAIHELATNAGKYGALSNATGSVKISWSVDRHAEKPQFVMQWSETGGPLCSPPARYGFGHTVLIRMAEQALNAEVSLDYRESGLLWRLAADAGQIIAPA